MNSAKSKRPATIHEGSKTVKLSGNADAPPVSTEGSTLDGPKDELVGSGLGATTPLGFANLRFRAPLQRSLSLQHFATYVWLLCRLYSQISGRPFGIKKSGSMHRKTWST